MGAAVAELFGRAEPVLPVEDLPAWTYAHALVDWITVRVPNADGRFPHVWSGVTVRSDRDGVAIWEKYDGVWCEGSHESRAFLRCDGTSLVLSFNPSRWNRTDNVFGCSWPEAMSVANALLVSRGFPAWDSGAYFGAVLTRVDVTVNAFAGSWGEASAYLRFLRHGTLPRSRTSTRGSSVYFKQGDGYRSLKVYDKGAELSAHGSLSLDVARWATDVGLVRVESTLGRDFLRAQGLREVSRVSHDKLVKVAKLHTEALPKVCNEADVSGLTALELGALRMWQAGDLVRSCLSRAQFFRLKKSIRAKTGFDIGAEAPLKFSPRQRVVLREAEPPDWYLMPDGRTYAQHRADAEGQRDFVRELKEGHEG